MKFLSLRTVYRVFPIIKHNKIWDHALSRPLVLGTKNSCKNYHKTLTNKEVINTKFISCLIKVLLLNNLLVRFIKILGMFMMLYSFRKQRKYYFSSLLLLFSHVWRIFEYAVTLFTHLSVSQVLNSQVMWCISWVFYWLNIQQWKSRWSHARLWLIRNLRRPRSGD